VKGRGIVLPGCRYIIKCMPNPAGTLILEPLTDADIPLFVRWLQKEHVKQWFENPEDWLDEIQNRNGKYRFIKHFIVTLNGAKIGFCQYFDAYYVKEDLGWEFVKNKNESFGIDYFIGEEEYLRKGYGKAIIQKLEEKIQSVNGREICADPSGDNAISVKTLLSSGFVKLREGVYAKRLYRQSDFTA